MATPITVLSNDLPPIHYRRPVGTEKALCGDWTSRVAERLTSDLSAVTCRACLKAAEISVGTLSRVVSDDIRAQLSLERAQHAALVAAENRLEAERVARDAMTANKPWKVG